MKSKILQIVVLAAAVAFIGSLNALVDSVMHPQIPFFDSEHLIVGSISGAFALVLLTFVYIYHDKQLQSEHGRQLLAKNFDFFFGHANDIIIVSNNDWKIVDANEKALTTYGYSKDELLKLQIKNLRSPGSLSDFDKQIAQVEKQSKLVFETEHVKKNGTVFPVEVSMRKIEIDGVKYFQNIVRNITERKSSIEALRRSEDELKLFRALIDQSNDAIEIVDPGELKILDVNMRACSDLGYSREELLSLTVFDIDPLLEKSRVETIEKKLHESGSAIIESFNRCKDGTTFPVEVNMKFVQLDRPYVVAIVRNISERKLIEEDLRKSQERFSAAFNFSPIPMALYRPADEQIVDANNAFIELLGYSREEILDHTVEDLHLFVKPEDGIKILQVLKEKNSLDNYQIDLRRKSGKIITVLDSAKQIEFGGVKLFLSTLIDISERQKAEESLRVSEDRYRDLVESSFDLFCTHDLEGNIVSANPAAFKSLGYDSFNNMNIKDLLVPEYKHLFDAYLSTVRTKGLATGIMIVQTKTGERRKWEYSNSLRTEGVSKPIVRGIAHDITERSKAEEKLKESEQRFREVIENAAEIIYTTDPKGKFTYVNPAGQKLSEYSLEELQKLRFSEIAEETHRHRTAAAYYRQFLSRTESTNVIFPIRSKSGKIIWISQNAHLIQERGEVQGFYVIAHDITELKEAQDALGESEKKYRGIFENASEGIYQTTPEGKFIDANPSFVNILGYSSREELLSEINDIEKMLYVYPQQRDELKLALEKQGSFHSDDVYLYKKDKQIICVSETSHKVSDQEGRLLYYEGTIQDITQRKQAEEALRISENKYKNIFNNAPVGIYQSDLAGNFLSVNDQLVRILDYSSQKELLTKSLTADIYFNHEERERLIAKYEPVGSAADIEIKWKKKDGTPIWIQLTSTAIKDSSGKTLFFDGFVRDISDRKKAELEIMKLSDAVSQSPASILITDINGSITYVNDTFEEVTGYSLEEVYMKNPKLLQSGLTSKEKYNDLWNTILSGKTWRGELLNKKKNGELYWEDSLISPVKDNEGNIINYLAVKQDITEKKKTLEELVAAKKQAEISEQLKTEFLAQMSHEIRTPLNIIMSNISFIKEEASSLLSGESSELFESIDLSSKRIIRTVDLILNMSELQTGSFRAMFVTVDLDKEILKEVIKEFSGFAAFKGLELSYKMEAQRTFVTADRYSLMQIFVNLIDNAITYTKNGSVWVTIKNEKPDNIVVSVKDTGIGMSQDFKLHMFEPFVQEEHGYSRKFEGSGLGLALVKKYCEINNATIEVESEKNIGSTFRIIFNI